MSRVNINLTAKDVCDIIKQCGESGVVDLELGKLKLSFESKPIVPCSPQASFLEGQVESEALEEEGDSVRERQISETIITDPISYEEMVLNGDIDAETETS